MNFTFTAPEGSRNHGNPSLLCRVPSWHEYVIFYFGNYFAHAATVISTPGEGSWERAFIVMSALLLPGSGIARAVEAIILHARTAKHPLKRAARAGALCMIAEAPEPRQTPDDIEGEATEQPRWHAAGQAIQEADDFREHQEPSQQDVERPKETIALGALVEIIPLLLKILQTSTKQISSEAQRHYENSTGGIPVNNAAVPLRNWWDIGNNALAVPQGASIHGEYCFPKTYRLVLVPPYAPLEFADTPEHRPTVVHQEANLASSYNLPKLLISFVQAVWAIITLYRSRGDQIDQYGYAAFGLTVAPYAFMSVINIVANLMTPEYPTLFMVRTPLMDDAENEGAFFRGEIRVKVPDAASPCPFKLHYNSEIGKGAGFIANIIPFAIVGALSRFQAARSTSLQRGFTMSWLVVGIIGYKATDDIVKDVQKDMKSSGLVRRMLVNVFFLLYVGVCAIGGMVVVGFMIRDYGICTRLD